MSLNIIIIGIFLIALVSIAVLYRNSTLDKLPLMTGEKILFEEGRVRVEQGGSPRSVVFINCIVRVTNLRIVIAQKMLFSGKYALRHVIFFDETADSTDLKSTLQKGYLNMAVSKADLKLNDAEGECVVRIDIPKSALTGNQYITYKTSMKEKYRNL